MVETKIVEKHGCFYLSSPDMPELHLCADDPRKLAADVPGMIKMLYLLNYKLDVEVTIEATKALRPARAAPRAETAERAIFEVDYHVAMAANRIEEAINRKRNTIAKASA